MYQNNFLQCFTATLVVQVEQSVCVCIRTITFEVNALWPTYLACWFFLTLSRSRSKVKVIGQKFTVTGWQCSFSFSVTRWRIWRMHVTSDMVVCQILCAKMVGATSSEGFLVSILRVDNYTAFRRDSDAPKTCNIASVIIWYYIKFTEWQHCILTVTGVIWCSTMT